MRSFLKYAEYTLIAEQEVVHQFFKQTFNFNETGLLTSATLGYTSYMLKTCLNEPIEMAIATLLPYNLLKKTYYMAHELKIVSDSSSLERGFGHTTRQFSEPYASS